MIWLILLFPLIGFLANGLLLRKAPKKWAHLTACFVMILSFVVAVSEFVRYMSGPIDKEAIVYYGFPWIQVGALNIPVELLYDRLLVSCHWL